MVNLKIDGSAAAVPEGTTSLEAARSVGISIPTLCYLKDVNEIGACRVCVVEIAGQERLFAACNNYVEDGMEVLTNSRKVRNTRRANVELILSQHDGQCSCCIRSGNCALQGLANDLGILELPYEKELSECYWNGSFPLIRDSSKCIKCMRCVQFCRNVQGLGVWDVLGTGGATNVGVSGGVSIENAACALCGQCVTHCPVGALHERDDTAKAFAALADPSKITVVQIAPAVRAAWGESLGLSREEATVCRLTAAIRRMGFNYIFDTDFAADLTIMEEGSELLERLGDGREHKYPMFTSCCPGWVRFLKQNYPDMVSELSSSKSPQQMFGAVIKTYFAQKAGVDPKDIFCISVMPCTAKKYECAVPELADAGFGPDVDLVLTTREVDRMIRAEHIDAASLAEEGFDELVGYGTGAGVIFGATGGVMEAALRSAYYLVTGINPDADLFREVRGMDGWREYSYEISGIPVSIAIASGLGNARRLVEALRRGEVSYDFVEIMACPGGCSGGGGQPICDGSELAEERGGRLYDIDVQSELRHSHKNPEIAQIYKDFLKKPLGELSHELLHTDQIKWPLDLWSKNN